MGLKDSFCCLHIHPETAYKILKDQKKGRESEKLGIGLEELALFLIIASYFVLNLYYRSTSSSTSIGVVLFFVAGLILTLWDKSKKYRSKKDSASHPREKPQRPSQGEMQLSFIGVLAVIALFLLFVESCAYTGHGLECQYPGYTFNLGLLFVLLVFANVLKREPKKKDAVKS